MGVDITTKATGDVQTDLANARALLDKAIRDQERADSLSLAVPLHFPEMRWEMVRLARRLMGETHGAGPDRDSPTTA